MDLAIPFAVLRGPDLPSRLDRAVSLGARLIRTDWYSQDVATSGWADQERVVEAIRARGMGVVGILNGPKGYAHWEDRADRIAWARWCREAASRFAGRVHSWQIANELNNRGNGSGTPGMPVAMAVDLIKRASNAVRAAEPDRTIVLPGISPAPDDAPGNGPAVAYARAWAAAGLADYADILACHVYSGSVLAPAAGTWQTMQRIRAELPMPVWITEMGASTSGPTPCTEQFQADFVRSAVAARPAWVKRMFWFTQDDSVDGGASGNQGGFGAYRLDGTPKPVAVVLRVS